MKKINCKVTFVVGIIVLILVCVGTYYYLTNYTEYYGNEVDNFRRTIVNNIANKYINKENSINQFEDELIKKGYHLRRYYSRAIFLEEWDYIRKNPKETDSLRVTILRDKDRTVNKDSYFVG